jgi:hypothetical protein
LQRRLDVVLLCGQRVAVVEFKTTYASVDARQAEDYALDLRDFHEASNGLNIIPILCAIDAPNEPFLLDAAPGVGPVSSCNPMTLGNLFVKLASASNGPQLNLEAWDRAAYRPVPSIIEAAELLYAGHDVKEIADASSDPGNLTSATARLIEIIADAQKYEKHVVVFVTGVPGSGKTLVGLNAIHDPRFRAQQRPPGAFRSGNTPLVTVLREALARDAVKRVPKSLTDARRELRAEIQGLMSYLEEYLVAHPDQPPIDKVIVFDEAQRAWDAGYGAEKFNRPKSEPALFLEIMERHADGAVVIALVGGGQEINRGERELAEWGVALEERHSNGFRWQAIAAPDVQQGAKRRLGRACFPAVKHPTGSCEMNAYIFRPTSDHTAASPQRSGSMPCRKATLIERAK